MNITKYEHACMVIDEEGQKLVVDPGEFTSLPEGLSGVAGLVVTHVHGDHLSKLNIQKLVAANPELKLYANKEVLDELGEINCSKVEVKDKLSEACGSFRLELTNDDHATIYGSSPCNNLRLVVNDTLYYPGDSLIQLGRQVKVLAVPLSAPWSKASEVMDFVKGCDAETIFPVHDGLLVEAGQGFYNNWVSKAAEEKGITYRVLKPGESLGV